MTLLSLIAGLVIAQSLTLASARLSLYGRQLPKDFIYGCGVTAYQVEGAWNEDGKGVSIWDEFVHEKGKGHVKNDATGDIAMDFYHTYAQDIPLFKKALGINNFDFTISWTRLLPNGKGDQLNEKGLQFYKNVADIAHKNGMSTTCTCKCVQNKGTNGMLTHTFSLNSISLGFTRNVATFLWRLEIGKDN